MDVKWEITLYYLLKRHAREEEKEKNAGGSQKGNNYFADVLEIRAERTGSDPPTFRRCPRGHHLALKNRSQSLDTHKRDGTGRDPKNPEFVRFV